MKIFNIYSLVLYLLCYLLILMPCRLTADSYELIVEDALIKINDSIPIDNIKGKIVTVPIANTHKKQQKNKQQAAACNFSIFRIKKIGEPTLCELIGTDSTHALALKDCDNGGVDNITECMEGKDPEDPVDDIETCDFTASASALSFDGTACRYAFDIMCMGCDDDHAGATIDYNLSTVSGTPVLNGNLAYGANSRFTIHTSFIGLLRCGSTIMFEREDFVADNPIAFGQDLILELIFNSCCSDTLSVIYPSLKASAFENQSAATDIDGNSFVDPITGDFNSGYSPAAWPNVSVNGNSNPTWSVGGSTFIASENLSFLPSCGAQHFFIRNGNTNIVIDQITVDGVMTTLTNPIPLPIATINGELGSYGAAQLVLILLENSQVADLLGGDVCLRGHVNFLDINANGTNGTYFNACSNWNSFTSPNRFDGLRMIDSTTGEVVHIITTTDASADFGF